MGFYSWITQDTNRSICNKHQTNLPTFKVIMTDNKGNQWVEENYDGYGKFGGKNYYELLAEMNGMPSSRNIGLDLCFGRNNEIKYPGGDNPDIIYPSLSESGEYFNGESPKNCPYQGYWVGENEN